MNKNKPVLASKYKIYGAFVLGLNTAIAFRALIVLNHTCPGWVRPVWYFAVLGNFLFFLHRVRRPPTVHDSVHFDTCLTGKVSLFAGGVKGV